MINELNECDARVMAVLPLISEYSLIETIDKLKKLVDSKNEALVCEVLTTLKSLNALNNIDIQSIIDKIQNPNIKAVIENLKT